MAIRPYLFFSGNCREAFTRYHEVLGGDLQLLSMAEAPDGRDVPAEQSDLIMHAALSHGDDLLMGSDDPTGDGGPVMGFSVSYTTTDRAEAERVFEALSSGGEVTMPLSEAFWSPLFGMCVDAFGIPWMIDVAPAEAAD